MRALIRSPAGKYLITQRIGFGAAWPRPQIDASAIACESSSSSGSSQRGARISADRLLGADAARRALAAGLVGEEAHQVERGVARAVVLRQHDHRRRADEAAVRLQRVEVERDVAQRRRQDAARRAAGQVARRTRGPASMPPQYSSISSRTVMPAGARCTPGFVTRPDTENERRPLRPWRPWPANQAAPFSRMSRTQYSVSMLCSSVGPAEEADLRDVRRAQPRHAALALDRLDHRRLFAADVGAGAAAQVDRAAAGTADRPASAASSRVEDRAAAPRTRRAGRRRSSSMPTAHAAISMPSRKRCGSRSR